MIKLNKHISISENGFLFDASTGDSYALNSIAAEILLMIKNGKEDEEIKKTFIENYDVEPILLERNFFEFTNQLKRLKLVTID